MKFGTGLVSSSYGCERWRQRRIPVWQRLGPGAALGDVVADDVGDAVEEGAEGRGGDRRLGLGLGGGGDREDGWHGG